ncbi:MAG: alpha/beta hydrolase [Elsteraceae bacterium]
MTSLFRGMDRAALDAAYNNRDAVPNAAEIVAGWVERSAAYRARRPDAKLDVAYGAAAWRKLDFFPCADPAQAATAPTLAFIHGGYWQANEKSKFSFVAEGPNAEGFNVAVIGYPIAPAADMDGIVSDVQAAVRWLGANLGTLGADRGKLYVSGHSAGGHLTAMTMTEQAVKGGVPISGIFELEPIALCWLNDLLKLDGEQVKRHSPQRRLPKKAAPLLVAVGAAELPELVRQSEEYWAAWSGAGLPGAYLALDGHDHFTVLDQLARADGAILAGLKKMAAGSAPLAQVNHH